MLSLSWYFLADVRGIVFDGRIGKSLLSSVSSNFVVSAVQAMENFDRANNSGSNGEHVCSGKQRAQCVEHMVCLVG